MMTNPWKLVAVLAVLGLCHCDRVLYPIKAGQHVGLAVLPGAYLTYDQYREIAMLIQQASVYQLWVYLSDTPVTNPIPDDLVKQSREALIAAGMPPNTTFVACGHSMGGGLIVTEIELDPSLAVGLITWGGTLMRADRMMSYPVPVMTVNGDLDGFVSGRSTSVARQYRDLTNMPKEFVYKFPVATVIGTNHGQYATGEMPPAVRLLDLPADKDGPIARKDVADFTSIFIEYLVKKNNNEGVGDEEDFLDLLFTVQDGLSKPIMEAFDLQSDVEETRSPWIEEAQRILADLDESAQVANTVLSRGDLASMTPSIITNPDGTTTMQTYAALNKGLTTIAQAYDTIDAKMFAGSTPKQCKELNEAAWDVGYELSSDLAQARFDERNFEIIFEDDDVRTLEGSWNRANLMFNFDGQVLTVRSPAFHSSTSDGALLYCKLLSPAKVLEFIYVDSLRL